MVINRNLAFTTWVDSKIMVRGPGSRVDFHVMYKEESGQVDQGTIRRRILVRGAVLVVSNKQNGRGFWPFIA